MSHSKPCLEQSEGFIRGLGNLTNSSFTPLGSLPIPMILLVVPFKFPFESITELWVTSGLCFPLFWCLRILFVFVCLFYYLFIYFSFGVPMIVLVD